MVRTAIGSELRSPIIVSCGVLLVLLLQLVPVDGLLGQRAEDPSPHSAAELIPEVRSMRPGDPFTVGLRITLDPGWHSYWLNPGDAGQPASITWEIPAGFRAGEIQWPFPRTVEESTVTSYGYDGEFTLLTQISPPRFMTTGNAVRFAAEARWLVCNNICLPASADLEFELRLRDDQPVPASRWRSMFAETRSRLPIQADGWDMSAFLSDDSIVLEIASMEMPDRLLEGARFFASERGVIDHGAPQVFSNEDGIARIVLRKSRFLRLPFTRLKGVLVLGDNVDAEAGGVRALDVDVVVAEPSVNEMDRQL